MSHAAEPQSPFLPTRWSLVQRVQSGGEAGERALEELCAAYWFPLYGWARRSGASPADAEDLVQGFFCDALRKHLFEKADATKGRLRTFLLTIFRRHQCDVFARAARDKRGGGKTLSFDAIAGEESYLAEAASPAAPDTFYDRQWALTVLEQAITRVGEEYAQRGKAATFERLRLHLTESGGEDYAEDGAALSLSPGAVRVAVHRLRERFREALREEVATMQDDTEDVDEELAHLLRAIET